MFYYLIVTAKVHDRERFMADYAAKAGALAAQKGGRYRLLASGAETLEGDFPSDSSVVISEWDSREAALSFWNSPEYQELRDIRLPLATCQVSLVAGPQI